MFDQLGLQIKRKGSGNPFDPNAEGSAKGLRRGRCLSCWLFCFAKTIQ